MTKNFAALAFLLAVSACVSAQESDVATKYKAVIEDAVPPELIADVIVIHVSEKHMSLHVQSVMAHEFGHVIGLAHMADGVCSDSVFSPSCATSPSRETMGKFTYPGEVCMRDLSPNDIASANSFYP